MPKKWRRRTHGTARQIGKAFVIDDESQQHRKARLPQASFRVPRRTTGRKGVLDRFHKTDEEKQEEQKRKRLKILVEKKERSKEGEDKGKHMMGVPIPEEEEQNVLEELPDEIRAEVTPVIEEVKRDIKSLSEILRESRFAQWLNRKADEYRMKREEKSKLSSNG